MSSIKRGCDIRIGSTVCRQKSRIHYYQQLIIKLSFIRHKSLKYSKNPRSCHRILEILNNSIISVIIHFITFPPFLQDASSSYPPFLVSSLRTAKAATCLRGVKIAAHSIIILINPKHGLFNTFKLYHHLS